MLVLIVFEWRIVVFMLPPNMADGVKRSRIF